VAVFSGARRVTGAGRSSIAPAKLNMAALAPMTIASEPIATAVKTGLYAVPGRRDLTDASLAARSSSTL